MSAAAFRADASPGRAAGRPPAVEGDDPPSTLAGIRRELAPQPGRTANTLRLTVIALLIIALCETFRIPNGALAAYMAFIIFKTDADATIPLATIAAFAILFGILISIVYFAATLGEPALRIPLMAAVSFGAAYLSRAATLGVAAFVSGLFTVIALTKGDDLLSGDLSPYSSTDTERLGAPSLFAMTPEEALVHNLLWLALAVAVAMLVILVVDKLTAPDPERKLRDAVAERLSTAASVCGGDADARPRLAAFARAGTAALQAQNTVAGKLKGGRFRPAFGAAVIEATFELMLVLLAAARLPAAANTSDALRAAAPVLDEAARAVRSGTPMSPPASASRPDGRQPLPVSGAEAALEALLEQRLDALRSAVNDPAAGADARPAAGLLKPDAFTNLEYRRHGFKVALAVMVCYLFMNLSDWSSISTCITTAFVVSLAGIGQSVHKMVLRVSGALVGAAVGFGFILFVMPALTDLGQLLCAMAPVLLAGAWVRVGGERFSYFGQQMAFAFMLVVVQDYGPTLHFQAGRDRVIGILVGEIVTVVVFLHIWPVSIGMLVRRGTAAALGKLADALAPGGRRSARAAAVRGFAEGIGTTQGLLADDAFEPAAVKRSEPARRIDGDLLLRLQGLAVPAAILAEHEQAADPAGYPAALAAWLDRFAGWISTGAGGADLAASLPRSPDPGTDDRAAALSVYGDILTAELRDVLRALDLVDDAGSGRASTPAPAA